MVLSDCSCFYVDLLHSPLLAGTKIGVLGKFALVIVMHFRTWIPRLQIQRILVTIKSASRFHFVCGVRTVIQLELARLWSSGTNNWFAFWNFSLGFGSESERNIWGGDNRRRKRWKILFYLFIYLNTHLCLHILCGTYGKSFLQLILNGIKNKIIVF